jgi:NADH-quinone oxidoreductase subunit D
MQEEIVKNIILGEDEDYIINMGPQHPSTHGVLRFEVSLQGERIKKVVPHCGYIHRGIEKMCERDTYPQIIHLTDRMDYLSAHINNEAVCLCVEKALEVEVPERVTYIRTILDELNRIASHQLWWCAMGMDMGALTTFFYGLRDREKILDIFEESFGSRLIHSFNTPGGFMHDIHPGFGVTGPSGRGSGFSCDVRKIEPYGAYSHVDFKEILFTEGDVMARYKVRIAEMYESMHILEQLVDNIPEGDYSAKMKAVLRLPVGEFFQRVETARGELAVFIVSDGNKSPYRIKFRSPNFSNLFIINKLAEGFKIADLVAISGSLDLVIPDIDR